MTVTIDKDAALAGVEMGVSIIGRDLKDASGNSLYDKVKIQERDKSLVSSLVDDSYGVLMNELGPFVKESNGFTFTLNDRCRFNVIAIDDIPSLVQHYLISHASAEWFKLKAVEFASIFDNRAEENLKTIFEKLRKKSEPVMKKFEEVKEEV